MNVFYDRKNDVVSVYFNVKDKHESVKDDDMEVKINERSYEVNEAANLILDMIDLFDDNGNLMGFRVFNASRYYALELLQSAEIEELSNEDLLKRQSEKVIGVFGKC